MPLDLNFGAGHLNVKSALTNFKPGEYEAGDVPLLGWDYGSIGGASTTLDYVFTEPIAAGEWVAITLAWDRDMQTNEVNNSYGPNTEFINATLDMQLTNLNVYLMPANSDDIEMAVASSTAEADSVEHIFFDLGENQGGNYKIRVVNAGGGPGEGQNFGIAWWAGESFAPIPGDFDDDGDVDGADLNEWKGDYAMNGDSDADADGDSDGADFLVWQQNLGTGVPIAAVPEPSAWMLCVLGASLLPRRRSA